MAAEMLRLGATVEGPDGSGVVVARDVTYGEALVKLEAGTVLDTTHGRWTPSGLLTVTGFNPDAWVWFGQRQVPASDIPSNRYGK